MRHNCLHSYLTNVSSKTSNFHRFLTLQIKCDEVNETTLERNRQKEDLYKASHKYEKADRWIDKMNPSLLLIMKINFSVAFEIGWTDNVLVGHSLNSEWNAHKNDRWATFFPSFCSSIRLWRKRSSTSPRFLLYCLHTQSSHFTVECFDCNERLLRRWVPTTNPSHRSHFIRHYALNSF